MSARRRSHVLFCGLVGCLVIFAASADRPPQVLFNATASAPVGFYWVASGRYAVGDLVAIHPPPTLAAWMARRRYLPVNVPLLKVVVAAQGQRVCGASDGLYVDGQWLARAKRRDRWGRPLPIFSGCRAIAADEVLIVNAAAPDSLDSRYFGPVSAHGVIGRLHPIWTWATTP